MSITAYLRRITGIQSREERRRETLRRLDRAVRRIRQANTRPIRASITADTTELQRACGAVEAAIQQFGNQVFGGQR